MLHIAARVSALALGVLAGTCLLQTAPAHASDDKDCRDFRTWATAQAWHNTHPGDNLDDDHDGIACEWLRHKGGGHHGGHNGHGGGGPSTYYDDMVYVEATRPHPKHTCNFGSVRGRWEFNGGWQYFRRDAGWYCSFRGASGWSGVNDLPKPLCGPDFDEWKFHKKGWIVSHRCTDEYGNIIHPAGEPEPEPEPPIEPEPEVDPEPPHDYRVTTYNVGVDYVIDGDTIVLTDGRTVRIIGIDAPEVGEPGADEATAALRAMLPHGRTVRLVDPAAVQDFDVHGRTLAYVDTVGYDGRVIDTGWQQLHNHYAVARYDSRDGYDWHPREGTYRSESR